MTTSEEGGGAEARGNFIGSAFERRAQDSRFELRVQEARRHTVYALKGERDVRAVAHSSGAESVTVKREHAGRN